MGNIYRADDDVDEPGFPRILQWTRPMVDVNGKSNDAKNFANESSFKRPQIGVKKITRADLMTVDIQMCWSLERISIMLAGRL